MPIAAAAALRAAIHDALVADSPLTSLLGGARVYDEPPRGASFPYVTLGEARVTDWSTGTDTGEEHQLTLKAKQFVQDRIAQYPALRQYLEHWGEWNPWP